MRQSRNGAGLLFENDEDVMTSDVAVSVSPALEAIAELSVECESRYGGKLRVNNNLSRSLVSFQANKDRAFYRWFKYKEAFSVGLVEYMLDKCGVTGGELFDPFAGIGTALFAASEIGLRAEGIELLPIGQQIIVTKKMIDSGLDSATVKELAHWADDKPWHDSQLTCSINELRITKGAYPADTTAAMGRYLAASESTSQAVRAVLRFALLCVLERMSYTRKDGQYLRWDHRSGRRAGGKSFDKGRILSFDEAVSGKLREIVNDLRGLETPQDLFTPKRVRNEITLHNGSCLDILPTLPSDSFDVIMTSPPYCNRYDYTRTYALELALLGVDEAGLVRLRQEMLSCTVENRAKDLLALNSEWKIAIAAADQHQLLQAILSYLDEQREAKVLNNTGIPRMVRGYFYEMACVIAECGRVLKSGAPLIMVNDNVRYAGASISVDVILSDLAADVGFDIVDISVLPGGKGNSSQQMGTHGCDPLRKCVYVWRKK